MSEKKKDSSFWEDLTALVKTHGKRQIDLHLKKDYVWAFVKSFMTVLVCGGFLVLGASAIYHLISPLARTLTEFLLVLLIVIALIKVGNLS